MGVVRAYWESFTSLEGLLNTIGFMLAVGSFLVIVVVGELIQKAVARFAGHKSKASRDGEALWQRSTAAK
jgi:hypothetical protein